MKHPLPVVSVVIPNFNYSDFLNHHLTELNKSKFRDRIQAIIVDGASTDNSVAIAKELLRPRDVLISEPDEGQAHAIGKGLERATGRWFIFQNSDDFFCMPALDSFLERHAEFDNFDVVAFNQAHSSLSAGGWEIRTAFRHSRIIEWRQMWLNLYYTNQSTLYDTAKAKATGVDKTFRFAMDYDFAVRFFKRHQPRVAIVNATLGVQRMHGESKTSNMQRVCADETRRVRRANFSLADTLVGLSLATRYHIVKRLHSFKLDSASDRV